MKKRTLLGLAQIGLLPIVAVSILNAPIWWSLIGIVVFYGFGLVGVSVTYHRLISHGAFRAPRWFLLTGSTLATIGFLLSPIEWATQHTDHHRFVDEPGDPHSPRVKGSRVWNYAFHDEGRPGMAAGRVFKDVGLMRLHNHFWIVLIGYIGTVTLALGWHGFVFLWAMPCLLTLWSGIAGVFMHGSEGARDGGWIAALLTCGEQNHNRHHVAPRDWFGDWPASWVIRVVQK